MLGWVLARAPEARSRTFRYGEDDTFANNNCGGFTCNVEPSFR